jgi:hypothetical protein
MPSDIAPRDQARFVFRGTVQKLGAATIARLAEQPNTAVVRVDQIIRAPDVLSDFAGRDITVQFPEGQSLQLQQQAIFYTNTTVLADSLAVQALDIESPEQVAATLAMAATQDPTERLHHHELRSRVGSADVVLSGRVSAVRLVEPAGAPATGAAADVVPATTQISEHMPLWREAVIDVHAVHKGTHHGNTAVVRFPASTDVRWHRALKFAPGQEGFFLLHRGESRPQDRERVAAAGVSAVTAPGEDVYTALHPEDFQPYDASDAVQQIIKSGGEQAGR